MTNQADDVKNIAVEADATAESPMPVGSAPTRPNKSVPVAVRLTPQDAAAIDDLAAAMNVPVSTLIRGWIRQGLAVKSETTIDSALDQIAADVQRLRELVA
ncbi:MAG: hypothetical protein Q8P38_11905 [Candidatus Nanopelagicales bacterium]|nr:hypothetical protein [Candidatus Nanopelagicales bacterium]MDZ7577522.1 hypothetical protein [Candidatus Nanopelagicales bacterium]